MVKYDSTAISSIASVFVIESPTFIDVVVDELRRYLQNIKHSASSHIMFMKVLNQL